MRLDWRHRVIVAKLAEGQPIREAAAAVGMTRQGLWWSCRESTEVAQAVAAAREAGREERTFRLWLRHPFRGKRPPTGKGRGGAPRFTYGRR